MIKYRTSKNVKYNNPKPTSIDSEFVHVQFNVARNDAYFTVYRSYEIKSSKQISNALEAIHKDRFYQELITKCNYNRSTKSEIRKWKAHNILYKFKLRKKHTKDTTFSTSDTAVKRLAYFLLASLYWLLG